VVAHSVRSLIKAWPAISLDFTVNRFFMKLFQTSNIEIVKECQNCFDFVLPSVLLSTRMQKFVSTNNIDLLW